MTALANGGIDLDTIVSEVKQGIADTADLVSANRDPGDAD